MAQRSGAGGGAMDEEPEDRLGPLDSFERAFPYGIILWGLIGALILAGSIALIVWLVGTFVQQFASFLSSLVRW